MKKLSLILICLLAGAFFLGCEPKTSPPDLPVVTPSQDDPDLMICDSAVPKPDRIVVFDEGSERTIEPGSEEFENIWLAVHNTVNGNEREFLEGDLNSQNIADAKQEGRCFEFLYDHQYTSEKFGSRFRGLFFEFSSLETLVFGYYKLDEDGQEPLPDDELGIIFYSSLYAVYDTDSVEELETVLFG